MCQKNSKNPQKIPMTIIELNIDNMSVGKNQKVLKIPKMI
jgi:hypothetical protein